MALSERQKKMLEFIRGYMEEYDRPPTIREIGEHVGISSTSVVNYNLNKLQEAGYIARNREVSRGLRLMERRDRAERTPASLVRVPMVGRIAAGQPIHLPSVTDNPFAGETIELTRDIVKEPENVFALQVRGDSMMDASVNDGDIVVLRAQRTAHNGEMVAVWLKDREETTLKYFYLEGKQVRLQPANPDYRPIYVDADRVEIQGKVIAVIRRLS
jgi:repressor LexA